MIFNRSRVVVISASLLMALSLAAQAEPNGMGTELGAARPGPRSAVGGVVRSGTRPMARPVQGDLNLYERQDANNLYCVVTRP